MLSNEIKQWNINFVHQRFRERRPLRFGEIEQELADRFDRYIKPDTLRHIIYHQIPQLRITNAIPTEVQRVYAGDEETIWWYENLNQKIENVRRQFVFNVDELGFSKWDDSKEVQVLVPSDYTLSTIRFPVERGSKRSSACFCIRGDGRALKPYVMAERGTGRGGLAITGRHARKHPYGLSSGQFYDRKAFHGLGRADFLYSQMADVVPGNTIAGRDCSWTATRAITQSFLDRCEEERVEVFFLVPYTSDQAQPLALVTFRSPSKAFDRRQTWACRRISRGQWSG
jgi:hypothetical protein